MLFLISENLFSLEKNFIDLISLIKNLAERRHTALILTNSGEIDYEFSSQKYLDWLSTIHAPVQRQLNTIVEYLKIIPTSVITNGSQAILVSDTCSEKYITINLRDSVRASLQPLYILVENKINDADFLRRLFPKTWRDQLIKWEERGLVRFENAGGITDMKKLITHHHNNELCLIYFGLPSAIWQLLNFIIYDHDGDTPEFPSKDSAEIHEECTKSHLKNRNHRIYRKSQEHYLPKEALFKITDKHVTNTADKSHMYQLINAYISDKNRSHSKMPQIMRSKGLSDYKKLFKNRFCEDISWDDKWFNDDGSTDEMTALAEKIAAAM